MPGSLFAEDRRRYAVKPVDGVHTYQIGREAIITIRPEAGYVAVNCPWHSELNGCHWWCSRGDMSLVDFLIGLDRDYAMGKLFGRHNLTEFDIEASIRYAKRCVIGECRSGNITRERCAELWEKSNDCCDENALAEVANELGDDAYCYIKYAMKPCALWFWDYVWSAFIKHLKASHDS